MFNETSFGIVDLYRSNNELVRVHFIVLEQSGYINCRAYTDKLVGFLVIAKVFSQETGCQLNEYYKIANFSNLTHDEGFEKINRIGSHLMECAVATACLKYGKELKVDVTNSHAAYLKFGFLPYQILAQIGQTLEDYFSLRRIEGTPMFLTEKGLEKWKKRIAISDLTHDANVMLMLDIEALFKEHILAPVHKRIFSYIYEEDDQELLPSFITV